MPLQLLLTDQIGLIVQKGATQHGADLQRIEPVLNRQQITVRQPVGFMLQLNIQQLMIILSSEPFGLHLRFIQPADETLLHSRLRFEQAGSAQLVMLFIQLQQHNQLRPELRLPVQLYIHLSLKLSLLLFMGKKLLAELCMLRMQIEAVFFHRLAPLIQRNDSLGEPSGSSDCPLKRCSR
ncbi:hypothetical protein D3C75_850940 [compost metagenome]